MEDLKIVQTTQEQAVASWINYLNQIRLDRLSEFLKNQNTNFENAFNSIDQVFENIEKLIETGRGGTKGIHGFIAETAEVGIGNARENILGNSDIYKWVDDNGMVDLLRGDTPIQQKFYQAGLSLGAISKHLEKYPNFIVEGGRYQIPEDQYDKIQYYLSVTKEQANKMPTSDGSFSLKQWKAVHEFFEQSEIKIDDIEPSKLEYEEVQVGKIKQTLWDEKESLKEKDSELREGAYKESLPTLKEAAKATAISAAIEGSTEFCLSVIKKTREGKRISEFDSEDWKDIAGDTGIGVIKGGVRGVSIYALTNYTATPASVASSVVTASFGVAEQAHLFRTGKLSEKQFIENSETVCLDAAVSALSSFVGQAVIPIPVVGAVIGNAVGTVVYRIAKDSLSVKEQKLLDEHFAEIKACENRLEDEYQKYLIQLSNNMNTYLEILDRLYSPNVFEAFEGSVKMAVYMGVPTEEILDTKEKIDAFFLD